MVDTQGRSGPRRRATTTIAAAIEGAAWLDRWAEPAGAFAHRLAGTARRRDLLSGTWLGHPVHPMLVAAPVGLWSGASLLDVVGQRKAAKTLVGAGIASVVPTAVTGISDWADTTGAERRVGLVHLAGNLAATAIYAASWTARRRGRHGRGAALGLLGAAVMGAAGWLGGHLAYALGVGVDTNAFDGGPGKWTRLDGEIPAAGPGEGRSMQAGAAGVVVLVAGAGGVRVLADRCSHRGGPLSEGALDDGCVTCPWHGSRFDLVSGEVVSGPAVVPQPVFEVRLGGDGIDVRRDEPRSLRTNTAGPVPARA